MHKSITGSNFLISPSYKVIERRCSHSGEGMKTVFDQITRDELIQRIGNLSGSSSAHWGKMNVYQMVKHCILWDEMVVGKNKYPRAFIGRLFGRLALRAVLKDEKPIARNTPTIREFRIRGNGDVAAEKRKWISMIEGHAHFSNDNFVHPFFGKMTKEEIGQMCYKHIDHHLRQFGC